AAGGGGVRWARLPLKRPHLTPALSPPRGGEGVFGDSVIVTIKCCDRRGGGGSRRGRVRGAARFGRRPNRRWGYAGRQAAPRSGRAAPGQTRRDEHRRSARGSGRSRASRGARSGTTVVCGESRM